MNEDANVNDLTLEQKGLLLKAHSEHCRSQGTVLTLNAKVKLKSVLSTHDGKESTKELQPSDKKDILASSFAVQRLRRDFLHSFVTVIEFGQEDVVQLVRKIFLKSFEGANVDLMSKIKNVLMYRCPEDETSVEKSWKASAGEHTVELLREYVKEYATWDWLLRKKSEMTEKAYIKRLREKYTKWMGRMFSSDATLSQIISTFLTALGVKKNQVKERVKALMKFSSDMERALEEAKNEYAGMEDSAQRNTKQTSFVEQRIETWWKNQVAKIGAYESVKLEHIESNAARIKFHHESVCDVDDGTEGDDDSPTRVTMNVSARSEGLQACSHTIYTTRDRVSSLKFADVHECVVRFWDRNASSWRKSFILELENTIDWSNPFNSKALKKGDVTKIINKLDNAEMNVTVEYLQGNGKRGDGKNISDRRSRGSVESSGQRFASDALNNSHIRKRSLLYTNIFERILSEKFLKRYENSDDDHLKRVSALSSCVLKSLKDELRGVCLRYVGRKSRRRDSERFGSVTVGTDKMELLLGQSRKQKEDIDKLDAFAITNNSSSDIIRYVQGFRLNLSTFTTTKKNEYRCVEFARPRKVRVPANSRLRITKVRWNLRKIQRRIKSGSDEHSIDEHIATRVGLICKVEGVKKRNGKKTEIAETVKVNLRPASQKTGKKSKSVPEIRTHAKDFTDAVVGLIDGVRSTFVHAHHTRS